MKLVQKSADKFADSCVPFMAKQKEINDKVSEFNAEMKAATDEGKKEIEAKANAAVLPTIQERDAVGNEVVSVELNDEEAEFLRTNFKGLIADNFKTVKFALEVADAFGVDFDEEVKK